MSGPDPLAPFELVAISPHYIDPAVDLDEPAVDPKVPDEQRPPSNAEILAKYSRTFDWRVLRVKSDQRPNLFQCTHLPIPLVFDVLPELSESRRHKTVFLLACHAVRLANGEELTCGPVRPHPSGHGTVPVDEEKWLRTIVQRFGAESIRMIAAMIYRRATEPLPEEQLGPFVSRAG